MEHQARYTYRGGWRCETLCTFLFLSLFSICGHAIEVTVEADKQVVAPGEIAMHRILVSNNDSVTRTGIVVTSNVPTGASFADGGARPSVGNCQSVCTPGEVPTWALEDMPAGRKLGFG